MWKQFVKDYFNFTHTERKGVVMVVGLIIIITSLPLFFPWFISEENISDDTFKKEIARLQIDSTGRKIYANEDDGRFYNDYTPSEKFISSRGELFYFDPNKASVSDWVKLGVRQKTAFTIQKYIAKGGRFRQPEDLKKIWGLNKKLAEQLIPFVKIEAQNDKKYPEYEKPAYSKEPYIFKELSITKVAINLADTIAWKALPGIGSKLSQRIVSFRNKLGGFHSIDQVGEVYLLPDSTFQKIKPYLVLSDAGVKKININTAAMDELKSHPYIRYNIANAIIQYRAQHGDFTELEQLKKIMIITDEIYLKLVPYLLIN